MTAQKNPAHISDCQTHLTVSRFPFSIPTFSFPFQRSCALCHMPVEIQKSESGIWNQGPTSLAHPHLSLAIDHASAEFCDKRSSGNPGNKASTHLRLLNRGGTGHSSFKLHEQCAEMPKCQNGNADDYTMYYHQCVIWNVGPPVCPPHFSYMHREWRVTRGDAYHSQGAQQNAQA